MIMGVLLEFRNANRSFDASVSVEKYAEIIQEIFAKSGIFAKRRREI